jgi:hypothetical protein
VSGGAARRRTGEVGRLAGLVDVLACRWGGRRAIGGAMSEREVVVALVAHLGLPTEAPPMARARSPAFELA